MSEPEELSPLWLLARTRERMHVVDALVLGQSHWPRILEIIAGCGEAPEACAQLSAEFGLDEMQATAVVDTQFRRLVALDQSRLKAELSDLQARTVELERIVAKDPERARRAPAQTARLITVDEVMPLLLKAVPSFALVWAVSRDGPQNIDDEIQFPDATAVTPHLVRLLERGVIGDVAAGFDVIERLIQDGDDEVQELTITYLQGVQNSALRSELVTLANFEPFLGPQSARWWRGLNAVWSGEVAPPVRPLD